MYLTWMLFLFFAAAAVAVVSHHDNNNETFQLAVSKFTIEQLINNVYPHKISNDIDLDPCKSGLCFHFISFLSFN